MKKDSNSSRSSSMKRLLSVVLLSAIPFAIGVENIVFFFGGQTANGKVVSFIVKIVEWILRWILSLDIESISGWGGVVISTILSFAILSVPRVFLKEWCEEDVSGIILNLIRIIENLTLIVCVLPVIKLVWLAIRGIIYYVSTWFVKGWDYSVCDNIFVFLGKPVVEVPVILITYYFLLRRYVVQRIKDNPFRKRGRRKVASDGRKYNLPASYDVGRLYLLGDDAKTYASSFKNALHLTLWYSETADMGYQTFHKNYNPCWKSDIAVDHGERVIKFNEEFAVDASLGGSVKWSDFSQLCIRAARDWKRQKNMEKAVHYYALLADTALLLAKSVVWPYRCASCYDAWVSESYRELIAIYRNGSGKVEASLEKALEYTNALELFNKKVIESEKRGETKIEEDFARAERKYGSSGSIYGSSSAHTDADGDAMAVSDDSRGVAQLPSRMTATFDGVNYSYVCTSAAGSYPAIYHCPETGDMVYIYRANVYGSFADTDAGTFYF